MIKDTSIAELGVCAYPWAQLFSAPDPYDLRNNPVLHRIYERLRPAADVVLDRLRDDFGHAGGQFLERGDLTIATAHDV